MRHICMCDPFQDWKPASKHSTQRVAGKDRQPAAGRQAGRQALALGGGNSIDFLVACGVVAWRRHWGSLKFVCQLFAAY